MNGIDQIPKYLHVQDCDTLLSKLHLPHIVLEYASGMR